MPLPAAGAIDNLPEIPTFSFPVPRRTLYLAKTVNAFIWNLAAVGFVALAAVFAMLIIPTPCFTDWSTCLVGPLDLMVFCGLGQGVAVLWDRYDAWLLLCGLELLCGLVVLLLVESGLIQLCITLGAVAARRRRVPRPSRS